MDMIVTQREGVVAIFTTNGDAELRQRAVLDIDGMDLDPRGLADLGRTLAVQLAWAAPLPAKVVKAPALPKPKPTPAKAPARRTFPNRTRRADGYVITEEGDRVLPRGFAGVELRKALADEIVAHVRNQPSDVSTAEIASALGLGKTTATGTIHALHVEGRLVQVARANGVSPARWTVGHNIPTTTTTTENR